VDEKDIRIRLLGPVRMHRGGNGHALGSGRRAAILAVLVLGDGASREQLVAAVWGNDPPASANGNVYTHVNALREILGGRTLTRSDGVYRLHVSEPAVDALHFEALRRRAALHRAAGNPVAELADLQGGLDLWAGEALAGVSGPFAEARRARLHELLLVVRQRQAEVLLDLGRHEAAITVLRPAVTAHPRHESLHRLLILALDAAGRSDEALIVHQDLSASLVREVGTEPGAGRRRFSDGIATGRAGEVLRAIAFLGTSATADEVCQVTGLPRATVDREVDTARASGVLGEAAGTVAFRDPAVAASWYAAVAERLRPSLHSSFADLLASSAAPPERVMAQLLLAEPAPLSRPAGRWLLDHAGQVSRRSPADTITLLQRARLREMCDPDLQVGLSVRLARLLFEQGLDAVAEAGWAAARTDDRNVQAEMLWIAACGHDGADRPAAAAEIARSTLSSRRFVQPWLDRFRHLLLQLRSRLPGEPTEPRHDRTDVVSKRRLSAYRREIAADGTA
jgi:DNA-binding SARP family transcriptional activator